MTEPVTKIAVLYPADPLGKVIGGIETFIRGLIKFSPQDVEYTLFGATTDNVARPVGRDTFCELGDRSFIYHPIICQNDVGRQTRLPITVRYEAAAIFRMPSLSDFHVLESHRIEHFLLRGGKVPLNLFMHQNMASLKNKQSDIRWRHSPGLYYWLERQVLNRSASIFCVREDAVQNYRERHPDIADRIHFVPTWMDPNVFYPVIDSKRVKLRSALISAFGINPDKTIMVAVGRLDHQKNPLLLLNAMSKVIIQWPDIHLIWVGEGNLREVVETTAKNLGLSDCITLAGLKSPDEIADIHRAADLFVMSSAYEGMPIAVSEALACGLPVASTRVGEIARLVKPGVNGELCETQSSEKLGDAIAASLQHLEAYKGEPCIEAASQYIPQQVLLPLYDSYRQTRRTNNSGGSVL